MKPKSEDDILAIIGRLFPNEHRGMLLGRGDDCAVLAPCGPRAVTTDIFAEDAHFRRSYFTPFDIGYKALAVNVSDVGSAGAAPSGVSVGLTLSGGEDAAWIEGFCLGMRELADRFGLALTGGDLTKAASVNVCITAWGDLPEGLPLGLRRGLAREGDAVFLIGGIGLARLGLEALEAGYSGSPEGPRAGDFPEAVRAHLHPLPKVREGMAVAGYAVKHALQDRIGLMDVSDGLARDLPRLLDSRRSGLGADVVLDMRALHPEVVRHAGTGAAAYAFAGGEDYALAGTCPAEHAEGLRDALARQGLEAPLFIGTVRPGGIVLNGEAWRSEGFDHFG
ncbi:MAG: thiamine-phosphate kinase [Mailhella sp.]|nr:thiamine-phosphate kinase [Mailhella sp.]